MTDTTTEAPPKAKKKPLPAGATGFMRVAHPEVWPHRCVTCHGTAGPLVDTRRDGVGKSPPGVSPVREDRIYHCANCVELFALELGLVDGDEMKKLLKAGEMLDVAAKGISERDALIERQMADLAAATRKAEALEELLQQERDAVQTHRHLFDVIEQSAIQGRTAVA